VLLQITVRNGTDSLGRCRLEITNGSAALEGNFVIVHASKAKVVEDRGDLIIAREGAARVKAKALGDALDTGSWLDNDGSVLSANAKLAPGVDIGGLDIGNFATFILSSEAKTCVISGHPEASGPCKIEAGNVAEAGTARGKIINRV
jgi:hypothetical protein